MNGKWTYKGHACEIWEDREEDNCKLFHDVLTPDGRNLCADISPYGTNDETLVEMWIDLGYPDRKTINSIGPLNREVMERFAKFPMAAAMFEMFMLYFETHLDGLVHFSALHKEAMADDRRIHPQFYNIDGEPKNKG